MSNNPDIYTLKKTTQPKSVRLPLLGKHDCYIQITLEEHHQKNCNHQTEYTDEIPAKKSHEIPPEKLDEIPAKKSIEIPTKKSNEIADKKSIEVPAKKSIEVAARKSNEIPAKKSNRSADEEFDKIADHKLAESPRPKTPKTSSDSIGPLNANTLISNNEINKLNDLLTEIIHSKVKTVTSNGTECSCESPECSCVSSKTNARESRETTKQSGINLPKPISSLTTNKSSIADVKKQRPDSKLPQQLASGAESLKAPTFTNELHDFPLEGHQQIADDIDELAKEIYSPEEREKKLRLLRLLIQEAIPGWERNKSGVPILNKTIEIPHMCGNNLKKCDSLIIRIIVEK